MVKYVDRDRYSDYKVKRFWKTFSKSNKAHHESIERLRRVGHSVEAVQGTRSDMDACVVKIIIVLVVHLQFFPGLSIISRSQNDKNLINPLGNVLDRNDDDEPMIHIDGLKLNFRYYNLELGNNNPIKIEFGNESAILQYWVHGLPLKLITHGWLASDEMDIGVFKIKTAYIDTRSEYNIITADWSHIAESIVYPAPAYKTEAVGNAFADFLDRLIEHTGLNPLDIHLIGHSLGAHVVGSAGDNLKSGQVGRITGLDPAGPGFEVLPIQREHLTKENAKFVDVIHTSAGTLGYMNSIGHADFFPNSGKDPQPGCNFPLASVLCSHSRSHELYTDSVYHRKSLLFTKCPSWRSFRSNQCTNNEIVPMGHDAIPSSRGNYYGKTDSQSPFGHLP